MNLFRRSRRGYLLLSLLLIFSILALTSSVGILERDTKLKRFSEADLKLNIDTLRRGIDLYKFLNPDRAASITQDLQTAALTGNLAPVYDRLIHDTSMTYIRGRLATSSFDWRVVQNLVRNPSFERDDDQPATAALTVGSWVGNFSGGDQVPNDWELTPNGAIQWIPAADLPAPATYVLSFWGKAASPTAVIQVNLWPEIGPFPLVGLSLNHAEWKRAFASVYLSATQPLKLEVIQNSANSGDVCYVDGIMLERWIQLPGAPATATPAPSAWAEGFNIAPRYASQTLQNALLSDLLPNGASPASLTYWTEW